MLRDMLWVSIGAILGANLRYLTYRIGMRIAPDAAFPYATLLINFTGSFALAVFVFWVAGRAIVDPKWRLLFAVGFCGAFTTFSTFAVESYTLFETGRTALFALNLVISNTLCIFAVFAGSALARNM
jgi:CrcB protein